MKLYNIFSKQNKLGKIEDVKLLKEGFSTKALLLTPFWFLYHKMWHEFFASVTVILLAGFMQEFNLISANLVQIVLLLIIAFNANYWLELRLRKNNYEFIGMVFGKNCDDAKTKFIESSHLTFSDFSSFKK